ncbi:ArsR/SmtB family transcription factor [Sporolactobacillus putidus]|uniref:Transcriptional regulator n=1 Tax=Sporolactobacillus putidus TaxID=492735 RepID=A0A917S884_9BACL|nr:helix-turn-helix transcriptional regulator [Sporolactobacillus putidus]GGL61911.1 transcriptional regulator [Sporolactobacillus putidus]
MREFFHPDLNDIKVEQVLYALSDPTRLAIVKRLYESGEQSCARFEDLGKKSNLSHHYRTLRECGLIYIRRDGRHSYMTLRQEEMNQRFPGFLESVVKAQ